jgi:hypothetical protein
MSSLPTLYHASYQLEYRVLVQIQLSIVQFQESTSCEQCSVKEELPAQNLIVILEDTRLCAIKREIVCYNCCV